MNIYPVLKKAVFLACLSPFALVAQPVFYEDWSAQSPGDTAADFAQWSVAAGAAGQFVIASNPLGQTGNFVTPNYGSGATLPQIVSSSSFEVGQGMELNVRVQTNSTLTNYFRIGLSDENTSNNNYWFEIHPTFIRLQKQTPGTVVNIGSNYTLPEDVKNQFNLVTLRLFKVSETENKLEVLLNNNLIISGTDTGVMPLIENARVRLALRHPMEGYIGEISLQNIPEPHHISLLVGAVALLVLLRFRSRK